MKEWRTKEKKKNAHREARRGVGGSGRKARNGLFKRKHCRFLTQTYSLLFKILDIINAQLDEAQEAFEKLRHATGARDRPARSCKDLVTYSLNTNLTNGETKTSEREGYRHRHCPGTRNPVNIT